MIRSDDPREDEFDYEDDPTAHMSKEELADLAAQAAEAQEEYEREYEDDPTSHMSQEELDQLAADAKLSQEEFERAIVQDALRNISTGAAKGYLAKYGDAVDGRITACLKEADALLGNGHHGAALVLAATAIELMIRFLLLRPLVQGAFLSDRWAAILATRVASGRTAQDREMLPSILREWGVDVTKVRAPFGAPVWEFLIAHLWPSRDNTVHRFDPVEQKVAIRAVECAKVFRSHIVAAVATRLGFTLDKTGRWCVIEQGKSPTRFEPGDPFTESVSKPKS